MFYCKIENNKISKPKKIDDFLPNVLNVKSLDDQKLAEMNLFPYKKPNYDTYLQKMGEFYFDSDSQTVTRSVIDKEFDIQNEKDIKIEQIKDYISNILAETDKYFIRKLERDIEIPIEIIEERQHIHSECDRMKNEISNLTNIKDILTYDYQIIGLNYHNIG